MACFNVYQPNGRKFTLFYEKDQNKNEILEETLLKNWADYLDDHWIWLRKYDPFKMNYEDKTKSLLERCGTFLLLGHFGYGNILKDLKDVNKIEVPLSEVFTEDGDFEREKTEFEMLPVDNSTPHFTNPHQQSRNKVEKRFKESQSYKISRLFSYKGRRTWTYYKLKNKDVPDLKPISPCEAKEKQSWNNKIYKNIFNENVLEVKECVIKDRTSLMCQNKPYRWQWCCVLTDNTFKYGGLVYKIHDDVKQYRVTKKSSSEDYYEMDKILVYEQEGKFYFFDMNIDQIANKYISEDVL